MVGRGLRKENGLPAISSTNIFAALESRRRKKRLDRSYSEGNAAKESQSKVQTQTPSQFWESSSGNAKSWADVEDDDDYYATAAPPPSWAAAEKPAETLDSPKESSSAGEETEDEEDFEDESEDGIPEEAMVEAADTVPTELVSPFSTAPTPAVREPAKQLSKKELKKKELADLDAVLQELGLSKPEDGNDGSPMEEKKLEVDPDENGQSKLIGGNSAITESKSSKRRKGKKEKSSKEGKDGEIASFADVEIETKDEDNRPENGDVSTVSADPKTVLKKLASLKKKKSMKDSDAASKAAAAEAAVRATKLAAAKKKEKSHYNQHPVR